MNPENMNEMKLKFYLWIEGLQSNQNIFQQFYDMIDPLSINQYFHNKINDNE